MVSKKAVYKLKTQSVASRPACVTLRRDLEVIRMAEYCRVHTIKTKKDD